MTPQRQRHLPLWNVRSQLLQVACDGGCLVSDAGRLAVRALDKPLRVIADLAQRLPDRVHARTSSTLPRPSSPKPSTRSAPAIPTVMTILDAIVSRLRAAWPGVRIPVRSDNGLAVPGLYDDGEAKGLPDAFGYATNPVLQRATDQALADLELDHPFYRHREPVMQRFESWSDYQAETWPHPRRIVAKSEVTPQGSQRRFVGTDHTEPVAEV